MIKFEGDIVTIEDIIDGIKHRGVYNPTSLVKHLKPEYQDAIAAHWSKEDIDAYKAANPQPVPTPEPTKAEVYLKARKQNPVMDAYFEAERERLGKTEEQFDEFVTSKM